MLSLLRKPRKTAEASQNTGSAWRRTFGRVFGRSELTDGFWDDLEEALIISDVGVETSTEIVERLKDDVEETKARAVAEVLDLMRDELARIFEDAEAESPRFDAAEGKLALMVVGINGSGKTTTIGKLASIARDSGETALIVAGDTFRAGAIRQAEIWAERAGARCVSTEPGGDPGAVVYDGLRAASSGDVELVIVDTAGRLHTSTNLMAELQKVRRVLDREAGDYAVKVLLVIDANAGQNGLIQAREFRAAVGVDGVALTKLDSSARGGIAVAIADDLRLPIWYVGTGESAGDLADFDCGEFVESLLPERAG